MSGQPEQTTTADMSAIPDELQQRYSYWKKNTKLLYDYLNTNTSKWPSLTCQMFPDVDTTIDSHRILLSSFTSSQLPEDEAIYISSISTSKHLKWASLNNFDMDEMEFKPDTANKFPSKNLIKNLEVKFPNGDCNRARYMPQNPDVIAGASSNGSIYIFDRTKHGSRRLRQSQSQSLSQESYPFEIRLLADEDGSTVEENSDNEVTSISWNLQNEGMLASTYSNGDLKIWDIKKYSIRNPIIQEPEWSHNFDSEGANDISWMPAHDSLLAVCGENNSLALFDIRTRKEVNKIKEGYHSGGINSCKFNFQNALLLASGDSKGKINLWDIRKLDNQPIRTINHGSSVSTIEWNPTVHSVIASAGQNDGLVKLWDSSKGSLLFTHAGHMLGVNDVSWDLHDPWLMTSVSNDNSIHIWRPAQHLVEAP